MPTWQWTANMHRVQCSTALPSRALQFDPPYRDRPAPERRSPMCDERCPMRSIDRDYDGMFSSADCTQNTPFQFCRAIVTITALYRGPV
eukprot:4979426-Prymnesium_polylepis.2